MGDCRYCGKPAGFLRKEHRECAERHASAQHRIRRLCVDAALHGGDLDSLPSRIREAAAAASIEIRSHELPNLLATGWCGAVEAAIEDLALSAAEKRGLNRYRMRFDLDEGRLDGSGHFQMFRMMSLLKALTDNGVVPRFDGASVRAGFGMLPFNLMKSEALLWVFSDVGYLEQVTRREFRGPSMSVGFRVAKGVYVRPGTFRGRAVESTSMEQRDAGLLGITTKHLYFKGSRASFRVRLEKIVSFEPFRDGLGIMRDSARAKPEVFTMGTTDVWFAVNLINALLAIDDIKLPGRHSPTLDDIVNQADDVAHQMTAAGEPLSSGLSALAGAATRPSPCHSAHSTAPYQPLCPDGRCPRQTPQHEGRYRYDEADGTVWRMPKRSSATSRVPKPRMNPFCRPWTLFAPFSCSLARGLAELAHARSTIAS